jgi:hypothetical protein
MPHSTYRSLPIEGLYENNWATKRILINGAAAVFS